MMRKTNNPYIYIHIRHTENYTEIYEGQPFNTFPLAIKIDKALVAHFTCVMGTYAFGNVLLISENWSSTFFFILLKCRI